jgi:acetyl-CoA C-acetyltransferase
MPQPSSSGAARTPFGRLGGGLASLPAPQLGIHAGSAALERAGVSPDQVGYVVMGEVLQAGVGMIPSRQVSAGVGCPVGSVRHDQQGLRPPACARPLTATS